MKSKEPENGSNIEGIFEKIENKYTQLQNERH